jgi:hypothetical protein
MELVLKSDPDTHSSEDIDISAQSYSDTDSDMHDITTQTSHSGLTIRMSTYCACSPQFYRGSEWVTTNTATLYQ